MIEMRWAVSDGNAKLQYRTVIEWTELRNPHWTEWTDVPLVQVAAEKVLEAQDAVEEDVVEPITDYMGGER